jgi:hypothetical protein
LIPLPEPFIPQGGACYAALLPNSEYGSDSPAAPHQSQLMIYEDGNMLGLAHAVHQQIMRYGKGRFSHWGENLYFSTSDNSDPNTNLRGYSYCERF